MDMSNVKQPVSPAAPRVALKHLKLRLSHLKGRLANLKGMNAMDRQAREPAIAQGAQELTAAVDRFMALLPAPNSPNETESEDDEQVDGMDVAGAGPVPKSILKPERAPQPEKEVDADQEKKAGRFILENYIEFQRDEIKRLAAEQKAFEARREAENKRWDALQKEEVARQQAENKKAYEKAQAAKAQAKAVETAVPMKRKQNPEDIELERLNRERIPLLAKQRAEALRRADEEDIKKAKAKADKEAKDKADKEAAQAAARAKDEVIVIDD